MSGWIISENEFDNFEMLSGLGEIINLPENPLSLRMIGILTVKIMILNSACQTCSIVSLETQIPERLHDEIMKHIPGEFLVSIYDYFTTLCTDQTLCTVRSCHSKKLPFFTSCQLLTLQPGTCLGYCLLTQ